jgi:GlcNAc-P-P-Und epimerase
LLKSKNSFRNKILITGANGFFGNYLKQAFYKQMTDTLGLATCDINFDISTGIPELKSRYELVIHAAGKAHVIPKSHKEKSEFHYINFNGTRNLVTALENTGFLPIKFVFVSTVAVYGKESGLLIDESCPLKGKSPYATSKIAAENYLLDWGFKNGVEITILRLPLLVGQNPPGNLGLMINAIRTGYYFSLGDGSTRRSMVLAEDVANLLASDKLRPGIYNLSDGYHPSFRELEELIAEQLGKNIRTMPQGLIKIACKAGDYFCLLPINSLKYQKLISTFTISDIKARAEMNWAPRLVIDSFKI